MSNDDMIGRQIPRYVAACPKCGASLIIEDIDEWCTDDDSVATEAGLHFTCILMPEMDDSEHWNEWMNWHYDMPYVDWMPLQRPVYEWYLKQVKQ